MKKFLLFSPLLLLLTACSGSGNGSGAIAGGNTPGTLTLSLGADSTPDWSQVVMGIQEVDYSSDGTHWTQLIQPDRTFDLLMLQNGGELNLATNVSVPSGTYEFKVIWATTNYANGAALPAYVYPLGSATGDFLFMPVSTIFSGTLTVQPNANTVALLMIDTANAVQDFTSISGDVVFQPTPQTYDYSSACSIAGSVLDGSSNPIANTEVFAEVIDGTGVPHVMRRAFTDGNGAYTLDGLPSLISGITPSYFIVAMPVASPTTSYDAGAVGPIAAQPGQVLSASDLVFSTSASSGQIAVTVTPATSHTPVGGQGTFVDLRQTINLGGSSQFLIVRADAPVTSSSSDTYTFGTLPSSSFGVNATRFAPGGQVTGTATSGSLAIVTSGTTTPVSLTVQ